MREILIAILLLGLPACGYADGLDEFIEEQREAEQDDVSLPTPPRGGGLEDEIRAERCVDRMVENIGLTIEQAEEWCSR